MTEKMAALAKQIEILPGTRVDFSTFPSGAAMLDVHRDGHLYVMAFFPSWNCFGVDEVHDDDGFLTSYKFVSEDFEQAGKRLWDLITGTESPPKGSIPGRQSQKPGNEMRSLIGDDRSGPRQ